MTKTDDGRTEFKPTLSVKISFAADELPKEIKIDRLLIKVEPYIQQVLQCKKCWKIGHAASKCKQTDVSCVNCGEDHIYNANLCGKTDAKCINCDGRHASNGRTCIKYVQQKEINMTAALQNITIVQARDVYRAQTHNNYRQSYLGHTYANVTDGKQSKTPTVQYESDNADETPILKR